MGPLAGKVALVTGAARGQGRSHVLRLAADGADVIAIDVAAPETFGWTAYPMASEDDLAETVRLGEATGRRVLPFRADVRDRAALDAIVAGATAELGSIDIVAANAGISPFGPKSWLITQQQWDDVIGVNLTGVWNTTSAVLPGMIARGTGGSIVITSSGAGMRAVPNLSDYTATKWAVIGFAKSLAQEVGRYRIRVNVLAPATVRTPMIMHDAMYKLFSPGVTDPGPDDAAEVLRHRVSVLPEPWVEPSDVSDALAWLACDQSRHLTGVVLPIDLGVTSK